MAAITAKKIRGSLEPLSKKGRCIVLQACGYNVGFIDSRLDIPKGINLIELGFSAYDFLTQKYDETSFSKYKKNFSLHIARSPITEDKDSRKYFFSNILPEKLQLKNTISLGFHLCGQRSSNIGRYGFSSHYNASKEAEENAISFISEVCNKYQIPVWIENSNFYSESSDELIDSIKSINSICKKSESKQIIDLAHLIINSHNIGVNPSLLIGFIDWDSVSEVHLSGIQYGQDGSLHDSHSKPVDEKVWDVFKSLIKLRLIHENVYVNIEHTDSIWSQNSKEFYLDFDRLSRMNIYSINNENFICKKNEYALSSLKKYLISCVSNYTDIANALEFSEEELFEKWIEKFNISKKTLVLTPEEEDPVQGSIYFLRSFKKFVEGCQA